MMQYFWCFFIYNKGMCQHRLLCSGNEPRSLLELCFCAINTVFPDLCFLPKCLYHFEQGLSVSYHTSHSFFIIWLLLERRTVPHPTLLNLHMHVFLLYPGLWEGAIKIPSNRRIRKVWANSWAPNCLKSAFFFLFWESLTMPHQRTPAAAEGQHSQVGLLSIVIVPVHRLLTSFAIANVLPLV